MKSTTFVRELFRNGHVFVNQTIAVSGWVRTIRSSKTFGFMELNDGSFFKNIQVVFDDILPNFKEISKLNISSSVTVYGKFIETPNAKQPFEIRAENIEVEGNSAPDYPLQKKRHSLEYLRTIAHLRPRSNMFSAVFRVRSVAAYAIHQFFFEKGFVSAHTPIITGSDCEGAGEMFRVTTFDLEKLGKKEVSQLDYTTDFFCCPASLTVSGQLNGESLALAFGKIYTFGPTFRAENSNTARHAAEFWMVEPEMAFADLQDNMELAEEMLKYVIRYIMETCPEEMEFFHRFVDTSLLDRLNHVVSTTFGKVTYTEAIAILTHAKKEFEFPVVWGMDLQTEHERYLAEEHFQKPVFVIDYPKEIKAFYMRLNDDGKTVAAMDCLVPGIGEIIGGSQREERTNILTLRMKELGLDLSEYAWYLDLRKYGETKHAGFGLGFERLLMYVTGITNIRDVILFPRTPGTLRF